MKYRRAGIKYGAQLGYGYRCVPWDGEDQEIVGIASARCGGSRADPAGAAETIQAKISEYSGEGWVQEAGGERVLGGIPY